MTGSRVWGLRRRRIFGIVWELARRAGRRSIGRCGRMGFVFAQRRELLKAEPWLAPVNGAKVSRVRKLEAPVDTSVDDARVLEQVVAYYHETLKTSPEALEYLSKRGLYSEEAIGKFRLGFANRALGLRLPSPDRVAGAAMRGRLQVLGVLRESGHEHFNGSFF